MDRSGGSWKGESDVSQSRLDQLDDPKEDLQNENAREKRERSGEPPTVDRIRTEENDVSFAEVRKRARKPRGDKTLPRLSSGEYILPESSQNIETEGARREFMKLAPGLAAEFAFLLRERVYPEYRKLM